MIIKVLAGLEGMEGGVGNGGLNIAGAWIGACGWLMWRVRSRSWRPAGFDDPAAAPLIWPKVPPPEGAPSP